MKSLKSGNVIDRTFRSGEKVGVPELEEKTMQYLYAADKDRVFMDTSSYEQMSMSEKQLGDSISYLKENMEIKILYHKGAAINIEVPMFVELKIARTDPGVRGDMASGGSKPATLETGAVVKVPLYMNEGGRDQGRYPHRHVHRTGEAVGRRHSENAGLKTERRRLKLSFF